MKTKSFAILLVLCISLLMQLIFYINTFSPKTTEILEIPEEKSVVYFYLNGCSACSAYKQNVNEFMERYNVEVYSINTSNYSEKELKEMEVQFAPTTLFIDENGEINESIEGVMTADEIWEHYEKL